MTLIAFTAVKSSTKLFTKTIGGSICYFNKTLSVSLNDYILRTHRIPTMLYVITH